MSVITPISNGKNKTRDFGIQAIQSLLINEGVQRGYLNECEVTTGQVDTGLCFVEVSRTTVTPIETFKIPVVIGTVQTVSTTGTGYIVVKIDPTKINNNGITISENGDNLATVEFVETLPTSNYLTLASVASGVITDLRSFVKISNGVTNNDYFGVDTSTTANTIECSVVGIDKLENGLRVRVFVNNANTGACVININELGEIPILKMHDVALIEGDLENGQIIDLSYSADENSFQMLSIMAQQGLKEIIIQENVITATAGEDIDGSTTPKACFIGGGDIDSSTNVEIDQLVQNSTYDTDSTTKRISQSIYFPKIRIFNEVKIRVGKFGSPSDLICDLHLADSNDKPTGSSLATATGTESGGVFTFAFNYSITDQLQKYVLVFKSGATANASNYYSVLYQNTDVYTKGLARTSSDSGSTYGDSIGDLYFEVTGYLGLQAGLVYLSNSTYLSTKKFNGFVTANSLFANSCEVQQMNSVVFSGLTLGTIYRIGVNGALSTTLGEKRIGLALSTSKMSPVVDEEDVVYSMTAGLTADGTSHGVSSDGNIYMTLDQTTKVLTTFVRMGDCYVQNSSVTVTGITGQGYAPGAWHGTLFPVSLTECYSFSGGSDNSSFPTEKSLYRIVGTVATDLNLMTYGHGQHTVVFNGADTFFVATSGSAAKVVLNQSRTAVTTTALTASNFVGMLFADSQYVYTGTNGNIKYRSQSTGSEVGTITNVFKNSNFSPAPLINKRGVYLDGTNDISGKFYL